MQDVRVPLQARNETRNEKGNEMNITFEEMKDIAKTLPIGYYLGRKVEVTIDPGGGAYADVVKSVIHVGMDILKQAASHIDAAEAAKWDREKLLRCVLYHEIGHLLLTPKSLFYSLLFAACDSVTEATKWFGSLTDNQKHGIMNVFEDERLECVLASVFMGVDFKGFCNLVNKGTAASKDPVMEFLDVVRLRKTTSEISSRIDDIIQDHATLSVNDYYHDKVAMSYATSVINFAYDVIGKPKEDGKSEPSPSSDGGKSGDTPPQPEDGGEGDDDAETPPDDGESDGESEPSDDDGGDSDEHDSDEHDGEDGEDGEAEKDGEAEEDGKCDEQDADGEETPEEHDADNPKEDDGGDSDDAADGEPANASKSPVPRSVSLPSGLLERVAGKIFVEPTHEVQEKFSQLARRLARKRGLTGAGRYSALHGKINVKRDAMDKERIFRRSADIGDAINRGTNITLWVDVSGSFYHSVPVLNRILVAANRITKIDQNIRINLVKMGDDAVVAKDNDWEIHAGGGNCINRSYFESWKMTRDKTRRNIDVVVFDGNAKSDDNKKSERMSDGRAIESVIWNHPDCHIVSDSDNKRHFDKLHNAHVTYMDSGYAEQLEKKFLEIVDRIM